MNMIIDQEMPFWSEGMRELVVRETEQWIVCMVPMAFNDRICVASKREFGHSWSAGYCYDKGGLAIAVALAWDPEVEQRPMLFKKIAFDARPVGTLAEHQVLCGYCAADYRDELELVVDEEIGTRLVQQAQDLACVVCGSREDPTRTFGLYRTTDVLLSRARTPRGAVARRET